MGVFSDLLCALSALCGERLLDRLEGSGFAPVAVVHPVDAVSSLLNKLFTAEDAENAETWGCFPICSALSAPSAVRGSWIDWKGLG